MGMLLAFALLLAVHAAPDAGTRPLVFGGERPVTLWVPRAYDGRPAPLLLVLHGYGSSGKPHEAYLGLGQLVEAHGVLLASPDGTLDPTGERFWNTGSEACCNFHGSAVDDLKYLRELLTEIRRAYKVDPKRVFVVGHSNGGFMAYRLGCELAGQVSAIVSIAGSMPVTDCHPSKPVRVLQIHGTGDFGVRYDGGTNILKKGGGPYQGAVETTSRWAQLNGCKPTRTSRAAIDLETKLPGAETTVSTSDHCPKGGDVTLWTIEGGSHVPDVGEALPELLWKWLNVQ